MKHTDLIEDYLEGRLGTDARREFERMLSGDPSLQRELQAEQTIRSAFVADRASVAAFASAPSAALTAKLAASSTAGAAATGGAAAGSAATGGAVTGGMTSVLGSIFGTATGLTVMGAVAVIGIVVGAFLFGPLSSEPEPTTIEAPAGAPGTESLSPDPLPIDTPVNPSATIIPPADVAPSAQSTTSVRGKEGANKGGTTTVPLSSAPEGTATSAQHEPRSAVDAMLERMERDEQKKGVETVKKDEVKIDIDVDE